MKTLLLIIIGLIPMFIFYLFISFSAWEFHLDFSDWSISDRGAFAFFSLCFLGLGEYIAYMIKK